MTTNNHAEPVRLVMNIAAEDWDADMADLLGAWRRGYTPPPRNLTGAEVLARLQARIIIASDHELQALAALIHEDPMAARLRLLDAIQDTETAARKAAAQTDRCMAAVAG